MVSAVAGMLLGPWAWLVLAAALVAFLVADTACLLAAAWIVVAWGKRRDKRLGGRVAVVLKTGSGEGGAP